MQNAAHAYLQTQVGTTGRGEIIVMLYDGALRFLAQAREKMEARDMAGKGMLISRALDIINELDSSLNMEAGGELAQNLHNLYFLCNTRLLQANLKLDTARLDSVVEILHTPEAQAACARMGAQKPATQQAAAPLPAGRIQQTPSINRNMAASLYSRQAGFRPSAPAAGLSAPILPPQLGFPKKNSNDGAAVPSPTSPESTIVSPASASAASEQQSPSPASPSSQAAPSRNPAPQPLQTRNSEEGQKSVSLRLGGGFAGRKLAGYGKLLQNK